MLLKRLQLWDLRLLLLRSIREENVVINQVNQFSQRLPIAMIRSQWSRGKTGKGRWKQARTKPLKRKSAKKKQFLEMNVRRKRWQFLIQVGFPFSDLFCVSHVTGEHMGELGAIFCCCFSARGSSSSTYKYKYKDTSTVYLK